MIRARFGMMLLLALAPLAGCIIDTVPTPDGTEQDSSEPPEARDPWDFPDDPYPLLPPTGIFHTQQPDGSVFVVGVAGTTGGVGLLRASNDANGARVEKPTAADGSFSFAIDAALDDTIRLRYFGGSVAVAYGSLVVSPVSVAAQEACDDLAAAALPSYSDVGSGDPPAPGIYASVPDASGMTAVVGLDGLLDPGITVVVANPAGGAASASVTQSGGFQVVLPAASGDRLRLFAVEPANSQAGGEVTVIAVPWSRPQ